MLDALLYATGGLCIALAAASWVFMSRNPFRALLCVVSIVLALGIEQTLWPALRFLLFGLLFVAFIVLWRFDPTPSE